ncbi:lysophospholipid acyltransferase [Quaeritorhiza haematococci]|nr:lysophospholipid acyltransferase [Quaeritorhiza haematococci]
MPTIKNFAASVFQFGLFVVLGKYNYRWATTTEYATEYPLWQRFLYLQLAGFSARTKFYGVWTMANGACVLDGFGFNGYDEKGRPKWDRLANVDFLGVEFATSLKLAFEKWNMNTSRWLRHAVYIRLHPPPLPPSPSSTSSSTLSSPQQVSSQDAVEKSENGNSTTQLQTQDASTEKSIARDLKQKPSSRALWAFLATLGAFTVSAIWHGFYWGYYLTFLSCAVALHTARNLRKLLQPFFTPSSRLHPYKPLYDIITFFAALSTLNYLVAPFLLLSITDGVAVWRANRTKQRSHKNPNPIKRPPTVAHRAQEANPPLLAFEDVLINPYTDGVSQSGTSHSSSSSALFATLLAPVKAGIVGILTYGVCQSGWSAAYAACVGGAGFIAGTSTLGIGAPVAVVACSVKQGLCMKVCAAMALAL